MKYFNINMFENNIYLNTRRIEELVNVLDRTMEFKGTMLPGGLHDVYYMGYTLTVTLSVMI